MHTKWVQQMQAIIHKKRVEAIGLTGVSTLFLLTTVTTV